MRISIYDDCSMIGMALSALLLSDKSFGPKIYEWMCIDQPGIWEGKVENHPVNAKRDRSIELGHLHTLQLMDNEKLDADGNITFLDGYFEKFESQFDNQLWSNWWGSISHKKPKFIHHDKLILCKTTKLDAAMQYATNSILKTITSEDDIDKSTEFWRMDHVETHKKDIGTWTETWHKHWHERCKELFRDGQLKYFYQLNRLHWAVFKQPLEEVKMYTIDDAKEVVRAMYADFDSNHIQHLYNANPDALLVDSNWMHNLYEIEEYLETKFTIDQLRNVKKYMEHHQLRLEYFKQEFPELFRKVWLFS